MRIADIESLKVLLRMGPVDVHYRKKSGEETHIIATLNEGLVKEKDTYVRKTDKEHKKSSGNALVCFALDRLGWRSLVPENILDYKEV